MGEAELPWLAQTRSTAADIAPGETIAAAADTPAAEDVLPDGR